MKTRCLIKVLPAIWCLIRGLGLQLAGLCRSYLFIIDTCFYLLLSQKVSLFATQQNHPLFFRQRPEIKKKKSVTKEIGSVSPYTHTVTL